MGLLSQLASLFRFLSHYSGHLYTRIGTHKYLENVRSIHQVQLNLAELLRGGPFHEKLANNVHSPPFQSTFTLRFLGMEASIRA